VNITKTFSAGNFVAGIVVVVSLFGTLGGYYGTADHIAHISDLSRNSESVEAFHPAFTKTKSNYKNLNLQLGYKYSTYVLGMPFALWTWDGGFVIYEGDKYVVLDLSPGEIAAAFGVDKSKMSPPITYYVPFGWVAWIGLVVFAVIVGLWETRTEDSKVLILMKDDRYKRALRIAYDTGGNGGVPRAVDSLVAAGISLSEAQANMDLLVSKNAKHIL